MEPPSSFDRESSSPVSLWASVTPCLSSFESLHGERRCEVAIVGGGFMGLSAALDLAEASVDVVLVEAAEIGWGASGRNNGLIAPLPEAQSRTILPRGESASDTQRLLTSFRLTADNRLIMGGASTTAGKDHTRLLPHLYRAARHRFPDLDGLSWRFGWSGYLALTQDHLPRIFNVADGLHAGIGCNGRGIAMATAVGVELAKIVRGMAVHDCDVPVHKVKRVFGFSLRHPGVAAAVYWKRALDSMERRMSRRSGAT